MFLKNIQLTNFRNFSKLELSFDQITLLIGNNAQGKSNILEAIYFLATSKSTRVEKDIQLIKWREGFATLSAEVDEKVKLEIGMSFTSAQDGQSNGEFIKKTKVNRVPRRVVDYIGNLVVVSFAPEDINLVTGPPALRRWHLDLTLAQVDKEYKKAITEYYDVINLRNRVLKRIKERLSKLDELDFWTQKALSLGKIIQDKRQQFFDFINQDKDVDFKYLYLPSLVTEAKLKEYQIREIASSNSLIGPHRDDFCFILNDQPLAAFGARGEQRTAVLDLKLLELRYIKKTQGITPILLLDDVFSELDDARRAHVMEITKRQQTIITAVANENIPQDFLNSIKAFKVENGRVTIIS